MNAKDISRFINAIIYMVLFFLAVHQTYCGKEYFDFAKAGAYLALIFFGEKIL